MIHDIEPKHLYNEWKPNAVPKRSSAVVQFCGRNLLCRIDDNGLKLPSRAMFPDGDERFTYLFELDGREYYLLRDETPREPEPERRLFALLSGMNIPILHLSRVGDSLEQVFLNVISQ